MTSAAQLRLLRDYLARFRFNFVTEADLQQGIAAAFSASKYKVVREYRLSDHDRLDFLIDDEFVIETKVGGSANTVLRQISRYAQADLVKGILLVTNRPTHALPATFNGKPLLVHSLMDGAF